MKCVQIHCSVDDDDQAVVSIVLAEDENDDSNLMSTRMKEKREK